MSQGLSCEPSTTLRREPVWLGMARYAAWLPLFYFAIHTAMLGSIAQDVGSFQIAYVIAFLGYLGLLWLWRPRPADVHRNPARWLIPCLLLRVIPLAVEPTDDAHRYLWEGRVQLAGHNPFVLAPDSDLLVSLRGEDWDLINHRDYPAIYPPLAQIEFLAAAAVHPSIYTTKALHAFWDALSVVLLAAILAAAGRSPTRALIYGACPLVLTAFSVEGHVDSLMILLLVLAWRLDQRGNRVAAGIALGGSIAAKLFPVVFLPWFLFRSKRAFFAALAAIAILYLPYCSAGQSLFGSLGRFSSVDSFFSFGGTLFDVDYSNSATRLAIAFVAGLMLLVLAIRGSGVFTQQDDAPVSARGLSDAEASRGLKSAARGRWGAWVACGGSQADGLGFGRYGVAASGLLILTIPVVHYWYFALPMVFLAARWRLTWITVGLLSVYYFDAQGILVETGQWAMPVGAPLWVWRGFLFAWIAQALIAGWASWQKRAAGDGP